MFIVGYELDRSLIRGREQVAARVSLGSIALPMAGGFGLGLWLADRHDTKTFDRPVPTALFVGAAMSVTAFPVLARHPHRSRACTGRDWADWRWRQRAVGDVVAWALLAVVVTISSDKNSAPQWHILLAPVYLAVMVLAVRPMMRRVADQYRKTNRLTPDLLAIVLAVLLVLRRSRPSGSDVHFIFGAFICGAVMPRGEARGRPPPVAGGRSWSGSSSSACCSCCRCSSSWPGSV